MSMNCCVRAFGTALRLALCLADSTMVAWYLGVMTGEAM